MAKSKGLLSTTIVRKVAMALSALFLIFFLLMHLTINMTSVFSADLFNQLSHFMGTNILVQGLMQPILIFGVVFHFVMGFVLELQNKKSRNTKYVMYKGQANASWMSRNMIYSGLAILVFIVIHFIDFWIPELNTKYVHGDMSGLLHDGEGFRYYEELVHKFQPLWRVALYCVAFVFLGLHLMHGFSSAFQSIGANKKLHTAMESFGKIYAIAIPLGFIFVAIFHHINH